MEHNVNLSEFSLDELRRLINLAEREVREGNNPSRIMDRAFTTYNNVVRRMGPKAVTLGLKGWSRDRFAEYISKRIPTNREGEIPVPDIMEEEAQHRTKEWVKARNEDRPPNYTPLINAFDN